MNYLDIDKVAMATFKNLSTFAKNEAVPSFSLSAGEHLYGRYDNTTGGHLIFTNAGLYWTDSENELIAVPYLEIVSVDFQIIDDLKEDLVTKPECRKLLFRLRNGSAMHISIDQCAEDVFAMYNYFRRIIARYRRRRETDREDK